MAASWPWSTGHDHPSTISDLDTGALVDRQAADTAAVIGFTSDGPRLLFRTPTSVSSWSPDGTVSVLIESQPPDQLGTVAVSPDGNRIVAAATGSSAGSVFEWMETSDARTIDLGFGSELSPGSMAISADGSKMVFDVPSATDPAIATLKIVDLSTGIVQDPSIAVRVLDGAMWVLGPNDRVIVAEPEALTFHDLDGGVVGLVDLTGLSPVVSMTAPTDGESVVTAHEDGSLNVWGLAGDRLGEMPATVRGMKEVIRPDGASALTVGYSGLVDRWVVAEQRSAGLINDYAGGAVTGLAVSPDDARSRRRSLEWRRRST